MTKIIENLQKQLVANTFMILFQCTLYYWMTPVPFQHSKNHTLKVILVPRGRRSLVKLSLKAMRVFGSFQSLLSTALDLKFCFRGSWYDLELWEHFLVSIFHLLGMSFEGIRWCRRSCKHLHKFEMWQLDMSHFCHDTWNFKYLKIPKIESYIFESWFQRCKDEPCYFWFKEWYGCLMSSHCLNQWCFIISLILTNQL